MFYTAEIDGAYYRTVWGLDLKDAVRQVAYNLEPGLRFVLITVEFLPKVTFWRVKQKSVAH